MDIISLYQVNLARGNNVNKEEILAKSRNDKKDEGKEYIESKGTYYGTIGLLITLVVFQVYKHSKGINSADLSAAFWFYFMCNRYGKFTVTESKKDFIFALLGLFLGMTSAIMFFFPIKGV